MIYNLKGGNSFKSFFQFVFCNVVHILRDKYLFCEIAMYLFTGSELKNCSIVPKWNQVGRGDDMVKFMNMWTICYERMCKRWPFKVSLYTPLEANKLFCSVLFLWNVLHNPIDKTIISIITVHPFMNNELMISL